MRVESQSGEHPALALIDDIQGVSARLSTSSVCHPTRCSTDSFLFPVDTAYELSPTVFWTHQLNPIMVRNRENTFNTDITNRETADLPYGSYSVDLCSLGLKVYLSVQGEIEIIPDEDRGRVIDCSTAESVRIGVRSFHESPSGTVTTTDQPRDVMRALSCLGSALKTTTCERSYPTLRGHPPLIERGERFQAPSGLERTDETASVRIEVPPTLESLYPLAPLAYYLNAVVRPGETPRLVAGDATYSLDRGAGMESGVAQILKHIFTLDCITRTEGLYPLSLGEREVFETHLEDAGYDEIDFAAIYEQPLAEQLQSYFSISFDVVEEVVPRWPLTADVRPVPKYLPFLPFVVASLGTVRCLPTSSPRPTASVTPAIEEFCRNRDARVANGDFTRAMPISRERQTRSSDDTSDLPADIYRPPASDSISQIWLADGYPVRAAKPTLDAFQRRFDATPVDGYEVAVVSNDTAMQAESDVVELYEQQDQITFGVTMHEELSKQALRGVLTDDYDLVHYVGHVDGKGLQCTDGWLDTHTLETVSTRMFVLNGCRSYVQGKGLVDAGAIGGLCTLTDVDNVSATRIGRTVARLINTGFSLGGALDLISEDSLIGRQYTIVGDPGTAIFQNPEDTPILTEITYAPDDEVIVDLYGYPSIRSQIGMLYVPSVGNTDMYYLNCGHMTTINTTHSAVTEDLQHGRHPVRVDGSLLWNNEIPDEFLE
ncbi:hypothetical protein [Halocatena marina]|uniref:CHAT domain-containing protein n=1 Tax=Halocatena marina TaxID=2934937 RepID=A0ABD5YRN4_9EURY|nr:hypothetical protein [Halocatena marina]